MEIKRNGSQDSIKGASDWFSGSVRIEPLMDGADPSRINVASVSFEPGARTAWHFHPLGQTLVVTAGCGIVQAEGASAEIIRPGDVIWTPPGIKHWHGALPGTAMTHLSIVEKLNGKAVDWLKHLSDDHYQIACKECREAHSP